MNKMRGKTILWSNQFSRVNEEALSMMEECQDETFGYEEAYEEALRNVDTDLDILRDYAFTAECGKIICYGQLGLWNGVSYGYHVFDSLEEVFYSDLDDIEWYVEDGELKAIGHHHDGANAYIYREVICAADELNELEDVIYYYGSDVEKVTKYLNEYTRSLGPVLAEANIL